MSLKVLYEDVIEIIEINESGKMFENVSRMTCKTDGGVQILMDINTNIYKMIKGYKYECKFVDKLYENALNNEYDQSKTPSLLDKYEYCMYGIVYKNDLNQDNVTIYISFGGLLMKLMGSVNKFNDMEKDKLLYILLKKVS